MLDKVLLLHANQLNADSMPELLAMMRRRGYQFVTLETALQDPAYRLPDRVCGDRRIFVDPPLVEDERHARQRRAFRAQVDRGRVPKTAIGGDFAG